MSGLNGSLSLEEVDGAQLPDLKDVAEIARTQFADMLSSEEGKKDLVIQGELMTLLEHVTPIKFLKKYEVEIWDVVSNEQKITSTAVIDPRQSPPTCGSNFL